MPILVTDLHQRLSITSGSAGNSLAQSTPNSSLGKYMSTTDVVDNTMNNLFDDVTGDENVASNVDYHCVFCFNNNSTLTLLGPVAWIVSQVAGGANLTIAIDNIAATINNSSSAQAAQIANEDTAPAGVGAFSAPSTKATGLALSDIAAGYCRGLWMQRAATNSTALNNDGGTVRFEGDSTA
jgi:hypothetical protein